jgi:hypothetical protein
VWARLTPRDDDVPEPPQMDVIAFDAIGYQGSNVEVRIVDDEPPYFQNPDQPLDVDADGRLRPIDALRVINQLNRLGGTRLLDPASDPRQPFVDVNGDYLLSPIDALAVINAINRGEGEGERAASWWWQTDAARWRDEASVCSAW